MPSSDTHYPNSVDVVVIGAGPGGSTTAAKLAQEGRSVLLLERRTHPRFHIGESMLPMMNAVAERLGVFDEIKAQGYVPKHGAEFSRATSGKYGLVTLNERHQNIGMPEIATADFKDAYRRKQMNSHLRWNWTHKTR